MPAVQVANAPRATATNLTGLNATTGFTISWWFRAFAQPTTAFPGAGIFQHTQTTDATLNGYSVGMTTAGLFIVSICGAAGNSNTNITPSRFPHRSGQWCHFAVTFDDATDVVFVYANGDVIGRGTNTQDMTSTSSVTSTIFPNTYVSVSAYAHVFDIQVLPNTVIPASDIYKLRDPRTLLPQTKARFFGLQCTEIALSGTIVDESGNGNNLTMPASGNLYRTAQEPPFRFTIA